MKDKDYRLLQRRTNLYERGSLIFEWLRRVGEEYKERGVYPVSLTDYYEDKEDVEVAAIIEILVPGMPDNSPQRVESITELHNILGEHPAEIVRARSFLPDLLTQKSQDSILGGRFGTQKSDVFNLLDWIWDVKISQHIPLDLAFPCWAGVLRNEMVRMHVPDINERVSRRVVESSVAWSLMKLCTKDGIGHGVWNTVPIETLLCPKYQEVMRLLRKIYPIERFNEYNADEIITFLGWDVSCEFMYACLACVDFVREVTLIGEKMRRVVDGGISAITWHKQYMDGQMLLPENKEKFEKERERMRIANARRRKK